MLKRFGKQTVKFAALVQTGVDRNGEPIIERTLVTVGNCHFRPMRATEKVELVSDLATEVWQLTAPPVPAVMSAKAVDAVLYDGTADPEDTDTNRFQIVGGVQPFNDFSNNVVKVTVACQKQS